MGKILEVNNLKISFRTQGGTVKAVRDISFDIEKGETLAIVGESGSGKSVTTKAILGILAGNSIVEGGEILFDGKDLLKIDEEEMHKIRGDKIAMIFQDPLSSLNPIVKIGKQITEAMLLKNKASRRISRKEFNAMLACLKKNLIEVHGSAASAEISEKIKTFDKFNIVAIKYETAYNDAHDKAQELIADIGEMLSYLERHQKINVKEKLGDIAKKLPRVTNKFLSAGYDDKLAAYATTVASLRSSYDEKSEDSAAKVIETLAELKATLEEILSASRPDFFRIGYYSMMNPTATLSDMSIDELNEMTLKFLDENFMKDFISLETSAIKHSAERSIAAKKKVLEAIPEARTYFGIKKFDKKGAKAQAKKLSALVSNCIDKLDIVKDSATYTFDSALNNAIDKYFLAVKNNPKEEARFKRQSAKREKLVKRGKTVDWKVVPAVVYDLDDLTDNILKIINNIATKYENDVANAENVDFSARAIAFIDFLKEKASLVVYKLTKRMAKEKAIKLMDEVGIPDSRIRYNQYPFEFSGGMRQRIVIAIALSANPDILICDEPTTALDVTIQAQILELINNLKKERNLSVIFITHDLGVVANIADKIAVMYAGKIVEYGTADDIFYDPRHPYTWALLSSMPDLDTEEKLEAIPGTPPNMIYPPVGDAFAARNKYALKIDFEQQPPQFDVTPSHWAATWLLHPEAPKVEPPQIIKERIERMKKRGGM